MQLLIFYGDENSKVQFTKEELEQLLQKVYTDGYNEGYTKAQDSQQLVLPGWPNTTPTPLGPLAPSTPWAPYGPSDTPFGPIITCEVRSEEK